MFCFNFGKEGIDMKKEGLSDLNIIDELHRNATFGGRVNIGYKEVYLEKLPR